MTVKMHYMHSACSRSEHVGESHDPETSVAARVLGEIMAWIRHVRRIKGRKDSDT